MKHKYLIFFLLIVFFLIPRQHILAAAEQSVHQKIEQAKDKQQLERILRYSDNYSSNIFKRGKAFNFSDLDKPSKIENLLINGQNPALLPFGSEVTVTFAFAPGGAIYAKMWIFFDLNDNGIPDDGDYPFYPEPIHMLDGDEDDADGMVNGYYEYHLKNNLNDGPPVSGVTGVDMIFVVDDEVNLMTAIATVEPILSGSSVSGMITEPPGVENIVVAAVTPNYDMMYITLTDESGNYSINVPDNTEALYSVMAFDALMILPPGFLPPPPAVVNINGIITGTDFAFGVAQSHFTGQVCDAPGAPMEGVLVRARLTEQQGISPEPYSYTDASGNYNLGVAQGRWEIYIDQYFLHNQYLVPYNIEDVFIENGATLEGFDFTLYEAGQTISGNITKDNAPKKNIEVICYNEQGHARGVSFSNGEYALNVAGQFNYDVEVPEESVPPGYLPDPFHYENVAAGATGINFNLYLSPTRIEGIVVDSLSGQPIENIYVWAGNETGWQSTRTNEQGYYKIAVPPGTWNVESGGFYWGYYPQHFEVTVSDNPVQVDFMLIPFVPGYVAGMVLNNTGDPPLNGMVAGFKINNGEINHINQTNINPDGSYMLPMPPGEFVIYANAPGYVGEFFNNQINPHLADPVIVNEGLTTGDIDFTLDEGGNIEGFVTNEFSEPLEDALVSIYQPETGWPRYEMNTDDQGYYFISGIAEGTYIVKADHWEYQSVWYNQVMQEDEATPVNIVPGSTLSDINFQLPEAMLNFADITVTDASYDREMQILTFGRHYSAHDGIDEHLGESPLPPPPPAGAFDARFILPTQDASLIDIRFDQDEYVVWTIQFQPGPGGYPMSFYWDPSQLQDGSYYLTDPYGDQIVYINMHETDHYILNNTDITMLLIEYSTMVPGHVDVNYGWNMISVPVLANNMNPQMLFPEAASMAFGFQDGYYPVDMMQTGEGYWLKFDAPQDYELMGFNAAAPVPVEAGWNMVGVFNYDFSVDDITTEPPGILSSQFYGFEGTYYVPEYLNSGKGYWIKTSQAGEIWYPMPVENNNKKNISKAAEPGYDSRITITEKSGLSQKLYLAGNSKNAAFCQLPPVPPEGAFDIRFKSGNYLESMNGVRTVLISSVSYPLKLALSGKELNIKIHQDEAIRIKDGGVVVIDDPSVKEIEISPVELPSDFKLTQNYPNPFNPTTKIEFELPIQTKVTLQVFNVLGEEVEMIINGIITEAGHHLIEWDASEVSAGLYFYRLETPEFSSTRKMVLLK